MRASSMGKGISSSSTGSSATVAPGAKRRLGSQLLSTISTMERRRRRGGSRGRRRRAGEGSSLRWQPGEAELRDLGAPACADHGPGTRARARRSAPPGNPAPSRAGRSRRRSRRWRRRRQSPRAWRRRARARARPPTPSARIVGRDRSRLGAPRGTPRPRSRRRFQESTARILAVEAVAEALRLAPHEPGRYGRACSRRAGSRCARQGRRWPRLDDHLERVHAGDEVLVHGYRGEVRRGGRAAPEGDAVDVQLGGAAVDVQLGVDDVLAHGSRLLVGSRSPVSGRRRASARCGPGKGGKARRPSTPGLNLLRDADYGEEALVDPRRLPDEALEVDALVRRPGQDGDVEERVHPLVHGDAAHRQRGFTGREGELEEGHGASRKPGSTGKAARARAAGGRMEGSRRSRLHAGSGGGSPVTAGAMTLSSPCAQGRKHGHGPPPLLDHTGRA